MNGYINTLRISFNAEVKHSITDVLDISLASSLILLMAFLAVIVQSSLNICLFSFVFSMLKNISTGANCGV